MSYMLVVDGEGEGCDYTLGCNTTYILLNAPTLAEARIEARESYNGPHAYIPWSKAILVKVIEKMPLEIWESEEIADIKAKKAKREEEAARIEYEKLKARFEGGT